MRIECEVIRKRDRLLLASRMLDLSHEGMLVPTGQRVLTGEEVLVSFEIPATGEWFDGPACVARVVHGRRPGDRGRCLGLAFDQTSTDVRALLRSVLRRIPEPIPQRRPHVRADR
jgi:Tfp pilus assembly protein PilZ